MKDTVFTLIENAGKSRRNEFIQIGVPLPHGIFYETSQIRLYSEDQQSLFTEVISSAFWPDGSIKWCLAGFVISMDAKEQKKIFLTKKDKDIGGSDQINLVSDNEDYISIKTKNFTYQLGKENFNFFDHILAGSKSIVKNGYCRLIKKGNEILQARIDKFQYRIAHHEKGPLYTEITFTGQFENTSGFHELNFQAILKFFYDTDRINGSITIHNPNRALHPSGKWDLGDENSIFLDEFSLGIEISDYSEIQWKLEPLQDWDCSTDCKLNIYQESSGGPNWKSPNHKNMDNQVALNIKGYICQTEKETISGNRADPSISVLGNDTRVNFKIHKFWQNFPKALSADGGVLNIGLFPKQFPDEIELQAGEKKTHLFSLSFGEIVDSFDEISSPINIKVHPDWLKKCKIFPNEYMDEHADPLRKIINEGLTGENSFYSKREKIDEYGWRNFGDLYADHEADLQTDNDIFVSHYNNQYDPLFGFLFQYLISGNTGWFELAQDLAQHITDIDIYHTELDKAEYNGGAFWHTDHYLDAATSSHRSHSRYHEYKYEGHAGGGGPGGQHCYTSGFLLHYLITGSESSKNAVFQLSNWITNFYETSGTFLDFLVALKNSSNIDRKNILTGQYPLDRGTAYYVNTLLDKFYLTGDKADLKKVEDIIRNTISPSDNISERELTDIENRWHYTVFLQSLIRYLKVKEEFSEIDSDFYYARDTLVKYTEWMLQYEYPYLEKPEILEFPNHTWTAQDIRKAHIFYNAALLTNEKNEAFLDKANEFYLYIANKLETEPSKTYTRILSILMQSPISLHRITAGGESKFKYEGERIYPLKNQNSAYQKLINVFSALFQVLKNFSIKKEIQWLDKRTQLLSKLTGYSK